MARCLGAAASAVASGRLDENGPAFDWAEFISGGRCSALRKRSNKPKSSVRFTTGAFRHIGYELGTPCLYSNGAAIVKARPRRARRCCKQPNVFCAATASTKATASVVTAAAKRSTPATPASIQTKPALCSSCRLMAGGSLPGRRSRPSAPATTPHFLAAAAGGERRQKVRNGLRSMNSISVKNRQARSRACKGNLAEGRSDAGAGR